MFVFSRKPDIGITCQMGFLVGSHPQANTERPSAHGEDRGLPSHLPHVCRTHPGRHTWPSPQPPPWFTALLRPSSVTDRLTFTPIARFPANVINVWLQRCAEIQILEHNKWCLCKCLILTLTVQHLLTISIGCEEGSEEACCTVI